MSETQVFVIRLFVNSRDSKKLCGSIESVSEGNTRIFTDGQSLLDALTWMARLPGETTIDNPDHEYPPDGAPDNT